MWRPFFNVLRCVEYVFIWCCFFLYFVYIVQLGCQSNFVVDCICEISRSLEEFMYRSNFCCLVVNRYQIMSGQLCMMMSSNGNIFCVTGLLGVGNSPVTGDFPSQRQVTRSFDIFFDLRLDQQFSKQWSRRWFETQSRLSWRHCNDSLPLFNLKGRSIV